MSTVPETMVCNYMGMKVLAVSCITNMATGIQTVKHSHARVLEIANQAGDTPVSYTHLDVYKRQIVYLVVGIAMFYIWPVVQNGIAALGALVLACLLYTSRCV